MTDEKWLDAVATVKEKFTVLEEGREDIDDIPRAFFEFIVFETPQGKMRIERTTTPVVLDKKTIYSKLAGAASKVQYQYSETEMAHKLRAYRWVDARQDWEELNAGMFA